MAGIGAGFLKGKRILILGAGGFVGKNLAEVLCHRVNAELFGGDRRRLAQGSFKNVYVSDLNNISDMKRILESVKPHIVINLASIVTAGRDYTLFRDMLKINVEALYTLYGLLHEQNDFELFVNMGTSEEYGDYGGIPCEEIFLEKPASPYAVTKVAGTKFISMISKNERFPAITVRPCVLFGEYQPIDKFMPYVIDSMLSGIDLELTSCEQTRDFLEVKRFCGYLIDLIESGKYKAGEVYNISSGIEFSLKEIVRIDCCFR